MIGVFFGTFLYLHFDAGWLPVAIATVLGAILAGIYVERICFWAIKEGAALASMASARPIRFLGQGSEATPTHPLILCALAGLGPMDAIVVAMVVV